MYGHFSKYLLLCSAEESQKNRIVALVTHNVDYHKNVFQLDPQKAKIWVTEVGLRTMETIGVISVNG